MTRTCFALLWIAATAGTAFGQRPAQLPARPAEPATRPVAPAYAPPPPAAYPAAYPYSYASTPAEGALDGMSNVIASRGNYNLSTSEAAINMTQAQSNEIQNHQTYENTYFQMRNENQAYQKSQEGSRPTEEELVRLAREEAPQPVSPSEVDTATGEISWPSVLQDPGFAADRSQLEQLSAKKAAQGSLGIPDEMAARKTIESMFGTLKSQIRDVPPSDYLASRTFLRSMIYNLAHSQLS